MQEINWLSTLDQLSDAVITLNAEGTVLHLNHAAELLMDVPRLSAEKHSLSRIASFVFPKGNEVIDNPIELLLADDEDVLQGEHLILRLHNGEVKRVKFGYYAEPTAGHGVRIIIILTDQTRQHELEEQILHIQKLKALGEMAGGIAHDFNNLLSVVRGSIDMIMMKGSLNEDQQKAVRNIDSSTQQGTELTRKLLQFSRKEVPTRALVEVNDLLRDMKEMLDRTVCENFILQFELPEEEYYILGDPDQLRQVFMNLIFNARDAMPGGGNIQVVSQLVTPLDLETENSTASGFVAIEIRDSGPGIPEEIREKIFDPFFTTKESGKGTGLGLAMVENVIFMHDGSVCLDSQQGKGTSVRVLLPLTVDQIRLKNHAPKEVRREMLEPKGSAAGTVLVVDDHELLREMTVEMLTETGYKVFAADSGGVALELFDKHKEEIDVVVMDMVMPGMQGIDCLAEMQKEKPGLKALLMSGHHVDAKVEELLRKNKGYIDFIEKPYDGCKVMSSIDRLIDI